MSKYGSIKQVVLGVPKIAKRTIVSSSIKKEGFVLILTADNLPEEPSFYIPFLVRNTMSKCLNKIIFMQSDTIIDTGNYLS